jgi:quinol monooxygenase YgiN
MSVVVVAIISPKPGKLEEVAELFRAAIPAVHAEDGCELYTLNKTDEQLVMIEKWSSPEALAVHGGGETLKALGLQLRDLVTERMDIRVLEAVPAGDPVKGAL